MSRVLNSQRSEWANKIEQWKLSGKSAKAWCRENQVVYNTFLGWHKRFTQHSATAAHSPSVKTQFIELKDPKKISSGISLEYGGVTIHLEPEFDAATLEKCLTVVRGSPC